MLRLGGKGSFRVRACGPTNVFAHILARTRPEVHEGRKVVQRKGTLSNYSKHQNERYPVNMSHRTPKLST